MSREKAKLSKEVAEAKRKREVELQVELEVDKHYETISGQLFHKKQLDKITREWQERRIIY